MGHMPLHHVICKVCLRTAIPLDPQQPQLGSQGEKVSDLETCGERCFWGIQCHEKRVECDSFCYLRLSEGFLVSSGATMSYA